MKAFTARRDLLARGRVDHVAVIGRDLLVQPRVVLDDLIRRGLRRPEFLIVEGAATLDKAIAAVWDGVPVQRCTVHKHRNPLAHAPARARPPPLHGHDLASLGRANRVAAGGPRRARGCGRLNSRRVAIGHQSDVQPVQRHERTTGDPPTRGCDEDYEFSAPE
jgi:Transposase, Mutator family